MGDNAPHRNADAQNVELGTKSQPVQERARSTFEAILATTGDLMQDVGFERISTNMICERAGLTPPALYRYFPNKYAVLKELGERLMKAQDDVVFEWVANDGMTGTVAERIAQLLQLYHRIVEVTQEQTGGLYIFRVMRATPILRQVRVESRELVVQKVTEMLAELYPHARPDRLETAARLTTEGGYAAIEVAIEETALAANILEEAAIMVVHYYETLTSR